MCIMEEQGTQDTLISEGADEDNSTPISEELTEHLLDQGSSCQLINQPNGEIEDLPDINHSDCLDGVEIETVMPEHVQEEEHDEELDRLSSQDCLEGNLEELSLKNHPEIEEIQCFPSNHDDHHDQETELLNQDKIEEPVESEMELDDPIVETVQFPAGSSADTILDDDIKAEVDLEEEEIDLPPTSLSVTTDANTILDTDSSKEDTGDCATLEASDLFKDVKFAVCEDIDDLDKIKKVLTSSGAKFLNYLSDSATHLIADNPDHSNVSEAVDIYEKPVVTSQWVWLSLRANKILPIAPFSPFRDRLFSQVKACPSRLLVPDLSAVWSMITFYGGQFQVNLDSTCTHLITTSVSGEKYEQAASQVDTQKCKIVTPDWVVDSIKNKALCDEERYHPRLLITFNVGKKIMERKMKMMDEKPKSGPEIGDDVVVTKATKSVTMAISTEAVVRKVDPFKPEHIESTQASAVFSVNQTSNVQTHINSVPNSTNSYPSLLASNIRQPQPLQQSKQVQLNSNQSNYVSINRHPSPAQVANVGQQHMHQISHVQMQQLPQPKKQSNPKQTNSTQVHAVKSKNQPKISQAKQTGLKNQAKQQQQQQHQQQQQQQQLVALTQPHFPQDHIMENQQSMMPHSHSVSPSNYHHAQMPQPQMINNQYRPQPNPALAQQQMGNMNQQQTQSQPMHPQQQQPQSQPMHSQQQQPRQVYLTLQQQQQSQQMSQQQQHQMQFINGSTQFVRQQFVTRPLQANMMSPQSQPQQHQQMGPGTPHPGVMPSSPAPVQQMQQIYRQQGQFQQQMQQQRQMQPMQYGGPQGQVPQSGQVYMNQLQQQQPNMIPGQMQRLALQQPPQQVQQPQQNQTMVQQQVNTQQQALINQNQYNHQMQVTHPSDVPSASISPANVPPQYQQVSPRMPVNMIRLANLSPEQQQQLIQQQKMQSSNFVPNMQQSPTVQQQMIRPMGPSTPGQQSPQPQVQMMSPNGTPIQQRMIMRPTMHPQAQQQSYQQMVDASKQQQMSVRPPVQMTAAASGQPQQFVHQQQQIQYIRQRWPGPQNVPNDFSGTPHSQFVNMAGGPRQISPNATGIQVPPQLSPQQQQIWIQQQQARRFALQPRMTRMPMNGPMQPQQHQQPPQSPMHPSMGGMQLPHDHTKMTQQASNIQAIELQMSSVGSHVEMASHAPQSVVHHALPPTPQPVPSQLASPNMVPFASSFHGHSPQSPLVPQTLPMNGPTLSQLAHMTPHPQVTGPRRPGTLPLLPTGTPTGPHHPIHHFGPHQHAQQPHMTALAPGTPAQSPHPNLHPQPQPTVQTPQPAGSQAPPQSQTPTIIQIRFFGHESRQMIPPEFCLIGCVFYIAPNYLEYSNTANLVPGWRRQIEKYGGRLVDNYQSGPNNNVTHVITENMSSSVAKMALQESKRCVSIFWLEDVLCNKRLLPPWRFYHLPLAYGDSKPCRNHIIAISNFDGDERSRLIQLIKRTGALYTSYLSSKNTILICKRLEGTKYEKAMQWRIAIVNLNWLQDILFGHFDALQLSSLPKKYQQFDQFQNASVMLNGAQQNITPSQMLQRDIFRVDYSMVHGLMNSWRAPIKYDNDEFNERLNQSNSDNDTGDKEKQVSNSAEERRDGSDSAELNSDEHAESNAEHSNQATTSSSDSIVESNVEKIAPKRSFDTMVEVNAIGKSVNEDKVEEGVEELHQGQSEMEPLVKKQRIDNELPNCETTQTDNDAIIGKEQLSDANNIASQQTPMEVQNEEQETTEINPQTNATVADALVTVSSENCDSQQQQTNTSEKTCESVSENDPTFNHEPSQLITLTEASTVENTSKPESETGEERATIPVVVAELTETTESQAQFKVPLSNVVPVPIPSKPVLVLFTGINPKDRDQLRSTVESLGGKVVPNPPDCTHLVANCIVPTVKFFCAFARAQHVLHTDWLRECQKAGKFVDEKGFQLRDRISEQLYRVDLARAIPDRNAALFQNTVFLLTRSCVPSPSILQRIIQANGGVAVIKRAPTKGQLVSLEERNLQFVVVTCPTDLHMCDHFFENKIKVVAVEFILNAILRQQLDYEAYSYRSDKNGTSAATSNQTTNGFGLSQLLPY